MKNIVASACLAVACGAGLFGAGSAKAQAVTYTSASLINGATVDFSVTTDGVMGQLAQSDITSWNIDITDSAGNVDLTSLNSGILLDGNVLSASSSALSFNFAASGLLLIEASTIGDSGPFYCAVGANANCYGNSGAAIGVSTQYGENPIEQIAENGSVVLGNAAAIPEPASLAGLMIGLGMVGYIRRRRPV